MGLERERLEVEAVGGVVVGRYGFRVAVDHHRFESELTEREDGVYAAVIELDALPDAVRPASENDDFAPFGRRALVLGFERGVEVRRVRDELRGARIDAAVNGRCPELGARLSHREGIGARARGDLRVAETEALGGAKAFR